MTTADALVAQGHPRCAGKHPHAGRCADAAGKRLRWPPPKGSALRTQMDAPAAPAEPLPPQVAAMASANRELVSVLAGSAPTDGSEARDLLRRAVAEVMLQPKSLRRLRALLRGKNERMARDTWAECFAFLKEQRQEGSGGPVAIHLNTFIPRPAKTPQIPDAITVESTPA